MHEIHELGHRPGHLRSAFELFIETEEIEPGLLYNGLVITDDEQLLEALRTCSDIMPASLCADLSLPSGSTYAHGVLQCDIHIEQQSAELAQEAADGGWHDELG